MLPHASLMIGYGGHGTTMQAPAHDLPLVLMPMHPMLDQPMVAASVETAGAGRVVGKKATAADLAPAITALLADGPHRAAAARLDAEIRPLPGARPTPRTGSRSWWATVRPTSGVPSRDRDL